MLNISEPDKNIIISYLTACNQKDEYEFECKFTDSITIGDFNRVIKYLKHCNEFKFEEILERDTLDISTDDDVRLTVNTKNAIEVYCKNSDVLTQFTVMKKKTVPEYLPIRLEDYGVTYKVKSEVDINPADFNLNSFKYKQKHFRYKKRFSFLHSDMPLRIDLTVVKSSINNAVSLASSKVLIQPEKFEIEIEYLNDEESRQTHITPDKVHDAFLETIETILTRMKDTKHLMSKTERNDVIKEYLAMVQSPLNSKPIELKTLSLNPKSKFLSYQPITLETENVHTNFDKYPGVISIMKEYTVTEKADGERMLLFVNKESKMYLINNRFEITNLGYKHTTTKNCILDGEFIRTNKANMKKEINKFM